MGVSDTQISPTNDRQSNRLVSECWIYTRQRGLREVTLHGNGSTIAVDGERLRRWCVVDDAAPDIAFGLLYSAESPTRDLRDRVMELARERFKNEPWFAADCPSA